jgi:hypothetical protein
MHTQEHEAVLERIVLGDLPRTSAQARALLDACKTCSERLQEYDLLEQELAGAGARERSDVAEALQGDLDPRAQRRIEDFVQHRVRAQVAFVRRGRFVALALAASLFGVLAFRLVQTEPVQPTQDVPLGEGPVDPAELVAISPAGEVDFFEPFTWQARELQGGETFRLRILDLDHTDSDPLVIRNIATSRWRREDASAAETTPVNEFFSRATGRIEWTVEIWRDRVVGGRSESVQASLP